MKGLQAIASILVLLVPSTYVLAQQTVDRAGYPSKPIRWVVPYPPGGPADVVARLIGERLTARLNQPVLVEYRPGGFGSIGMEAVARAQPDGHTILMGGSTEIINRALGRGGADPLVDLKPVAQLVRITFVLLANPQFQSKTIGEVLAAAKAAPGAITCGSGAPILRIGCELLKSQGGVEISVIPYQGAAIALRDLMGGQVNLAFNATSTALPAVQAKRAFPIATANRARGSGPFSELPTVAETLPGFELESWFGVLAPNGTPTEIIMRLNHQLAVVLDDENVRARLVDSGLEIHHTSPGILAERMRAEYKKYSTIIAAAGIKED